MRLTSVVVIALAFALKSNAYQDPSRSGGIRFDPGSGQVNLPELEAQSQADPENLLLRAKLLTYYAGSGPAEKYVQQSLWMIEHHPEAEAAAGIAQPPRSGRETISPADYALIKAAWEQALIDHADSGMVLYHAGLFVARQEPLRAAHLLEQARQLLTENFDVLTAESNIFAAAFDKQDPNQTRSSSSLRFTSDDAQALRSEVASSSDPALLAEVGFYLTRRSYFNPNDGQKQKGIELIHQAISLDPGNPKWKAALENATHPAPPPPPPPPPPSHDATPGFVRIASQVAEANLMTKVDPQYPALALSARVSGTVEFTAVIGSKGRIQHLQLVRGHPLLVNAAKEAVLQYVYKPTLLNGNPISVVTSISVPFNVPPE